MHAPAVEYTSSLAGLGALLSYFTAVLQKLLLGHSFIHIIINFILKDGCRLAFVIEAVLQACLPLL